MSGHRTSCIYCNRECALEGGDYLVHADDGSDYCTMPAGMFEVTRRTKLPGGCDKRLLPEYEGQLT